MSKNYSSKLNFDETIVSVFTEFRIYCKITCNTFDLFTYLKVDANNANVAQEIQSRLKELKKNSPIPPDSVEEELVQERAVRQNAEFYLTTNEEVGAYVRYSALEGIVEHVRQGDFYTISNIDALVTRAMSTHSAHFADVTVDDVLNYIEAKSKRAVRACPCCGIPTNLEVCPCGLPMEKWDKYRSGIAYVFQMYGMLKEFYTVALKSKSVAIMGDVIDAFERRKLAFFKARDVFLAVFPYAKNEKWEKGVGTHANLDIERMESDMEEYDIQLSVQIKQDKINNSRPAPTQPSRLNHRLKR